MNPSNGKGIGVAGWVGKESTGRRLTRWLPVPAALALFALVGMALSTEDRNEFQTRTNQVAARPETGDALSPATTTGADGDPREPSTTLTPVSDPSAPPSSSTGEPEGSGGAAVSFEITGASGRLGIELGPRGPLARPVSPDGTLSQPVELLDGPTGPTTGDGTGTASGTGGISGAGSSTSSPTGPTSTSPPSTSPPSTTPSSTVGSSSPTAGGGKVTGDATATTGTDGPSGDGTTLDSQGQPVGLRLGDDGRLEPVSQEEIAAGDLVVAPTADGLEVLLAGGTRVAIQSGARPDRSPIDVTEISPEGARSQLVPDDQGEITLGNGLTIRVPAPGEGADDTSASAWSKVLGSNRWRWVALTLAGVLALAVLAQLYRRRRPAPDGEPNGAGWVGSTGVPVHRFEEFLDLLAADPDPGRAVRLAFSAAERGLGHLPRRQSTETPFEWYRRVATERPDLAEPLAGLCGCFANVRFAPGTATAQDRDLGVAELRRLHRLSRHGPPPSDPAEAPMEVGAGV